jgi:Holliday junction resolvasome RuvABC endonuclease subunit
MATQTDRKSFRILSIAPSSCGFGFVVLEGDEIFVDWGVKKVTGNKNAKSLKKAEELIVQYEPAVLVLENTLANGSRRSPRIRALTRQIVKMATARKIHIKQFSRDQVMNAYIPNRKGTKQEVAEIIAQRFPMELSSSLPAKRKLWKSEDSRMTIFDAAALALTFRMK